MEKNNGAKRIRNTQTNHMWAKIDPIIHRRFEEAVERNEED